MSRLNVVFAAKLVFFSMVCTPVFAETVQVSAISEESLLAKSDAKTRVNLAGRQRMLSQRMSRSACLLELGVDTEKHMAILGTARADFVRVLQGLRTKDEEIGLIEDETSSKVIKGIMVVEDVWASFDGALAEMTDATSFDRSVSKGVYENSEALLFEMNELVSTIEQMHADPFEMMAAHGIAINIAGRQRMLTQKMGKELCLASADWQPVETRTKLLKTMKMFEVSHDALLNGNANFGMKKAPTEEIRTRLEALGERWLDLRPIAQAGVNGGMLTNDKLAEFAIKSDSLLKEMHEIVGLFEKR